MVGRDETRDTRHLVKLLIDAGRLGSLKSPKFEHVVKHMGNMLIVDENCGQMHDALYDTAKTIELYRKCVEFANSDLRMLTDEQVKEIGE